MTDIMLDLETMSQSSCAAITAIGAVRFDLAGGGIEDSFYKVVNLKSSVRDGGMIDPETILWWMKQSDAARQEFSKPGLDIKDALTQFLHWAVRGHHLYDIRMWGNGAAFDNVILSGAYDRAGQEKPWKYTGDRCYRTIKALYPEITIPKEGIKHNALDDATWQAKHLIEILKETK